MKTFKVAVDSGECWYVQDNRTKERVGGKYGNYFFTRKETREVVNQLNALYNFINEGK
jgi:hypothetical protein